MRSQVEILLGRESLVVVEHVDRKHVADEGSSEDCSAVAGRYIRRRKIVAVVSGGEVSVSIDEVEPVDVALLAHQQDVVSCFSPLTDDVGLEDVRTGPPQQVTVPQQDSHGLAPYTSGPCPSTALRRSSS